MDNTARIWDAPTAKEIAVFRHLESQNKYDWVLQPVFSYPSVERLIEGLEDKIVKPAEAKFNKRLTRRTKQLRVGKM